MTGYTRTSDVEVRIEARKIAGETAFRYHISADYVSGDGKMSRHMTVYSTEELDAMLKTF